MAVYKGIDKGDKNYRHFTYDGETITRNGVAYYKVTYEKNPLMGDTGEEEVGYVACDRMIPIGPRPKALTIKKPVQSKPVVKEEPVKVQAEKPKRGRPKKVQEEKPTEGISNPNFYTGDTRFEYLVEEMHSDHPGDLQNQLNKLGAEGWELCGFDMNTSIFSNIHIIVIFKRIK